MTDKRIKDLDVLGTPAGTEAIATDDAGSGTNQITLADLRAWVTRPTIYSVAHSDSPYEVPLGPLVMLVVDCTDGNITLDLNADSEDGDMVIVKDIANSGGISRGKYTIQRAGGGPLIDHSNTFPASGGDTNVYKSTTVIYSATANQWHVVSHYPGIAAGGG